MILLHFSHTFSGTLQTPGYSSFFQTSPEMQLNAATQTAVKSLLISLLFFLLFLIFVSVKRCERMMQQQTTFQFSSRPIFICQRGMRFFHTLAATLMFGINKALSSMIRNEWQPTETGLLNGYVGFFAHPPASFVCPPQPHTPKSCFCTV